MFWHALKLDRTKLKACVGLSAINSPSHTSHVYLKASMPHIQVHGAQWGQCMIFPVAHPAWSFSNSCITAVHTGGSWWKWGPIWGLLVAQRRFRSGLAGCPPFCFFYFTSWPGITISTRPYISGSSGLMSCNCLQGMRLVQSLRMSHPQLPAVFSPRWTAPPPPLRAWTPTRPNFCSTHLLFL